MDRTAIYIDGGYIDQILKYEFNGASIDYGRLADHIAQGREVLRTYYYNCPPYQSNPPTEEESTRVANKQRFFSALSRLDRYQVRLGKLAKRGTDADDNPIFVQKRVDIMLGVDMVQLAATRQIQRAVLLAGDSDFLPAIEAVKTHGVLVSLWHGPKRRGPQNTVHQALWDACDERNELTTDVVNRLRRLPRSS